MSQTTSGLYHLVDLPWFSRVVQEILRGPGALGLLYHLDDAAVQPRFRRRAQFSAQRGVSSPSIPAAYPASIPLPAFSSAATPAVQFAMRQAAGGWLRPYSPA